MAYTALEKMRGLNADRYGRDVGPMQPVLSDGARDGYDLKSAAFRFLHERCENPCFDTQIEKEEARTGRWRGTSLKPGQIPYNMQTDINRLCLERDLERFIDSGATQDAFKEIPHNTAAPFPEGLASRRWRCLFTKRSKSVRATSAACRCFDLPPGSADPGAKSREINAEMQAKTP